MGSSSKKHKSEKKGKRHRSEEREKGERHRSHKRHKSHRHKPEEIEIISSEDENGPDVPPPPPPVISDSSPPSGNSALASGKSRESISIEETNAIRAKLGLKPLQVEGSSSTAEKKEKRVAEDGTDMGEFVHKPATNIADKKRGDKIKERLQQRKDKRAIEEKLKTIRGLGESDEDDDAKDWVKKSRQKEKEKKEADRRAKMLEELDEEFGIGALVEEERKTERKDLYTSRDLLGLRVGHAVDGFEEGRNVILTLKDGDVLDESEDTLVNVNMIDNERYKKNVEIKKKSKTYDDDEDMEVEPSDRSVLSKYDEEIDGEKEDYFSLGEDMSAAYRMKQKLAIRKKLTAKKAVDLNSDNMKLASDYYTEDEVSAKFRKPGKFKRLRKKPKTLKADDLVRKMDVEWPTEDFGCRRRPTVLTQDDVAEGEAMDIVKEELDIVLDVDDSLLPSDDLYQIKLEPDEPELELQRALNKARKLKHKQSKDNPVERIAMDAQKEMSTSDDGPGGSITLNSTAEFCRTLGDIPTYGQSGNREEEEELLDFEREMKEEQQRWDEERKNRGAWSTVHNDTKEAEPVPEDVPILDEEPDVGKGIAGALRLAISKGYLEKETISGRPSARFAHLQAQNYSIEDKAHGEDEKFGRRDRFAGPTTDFKEKDNYKPNVNLDYIDDDGRLLNQKEAFRYLSHKFHGKGPGKNKVEKRMKKNEQDGLMKQMSSTDTPLRTLTMLQQKQKETQSAFVILSGKGQAGASSSISKTK